MGENAGMKLDDEGGIAIYIAEKQPAGVPPENWLPISREDLPLRLQIRVYRPDLEALWHWRTPQVERLDVPGPGAGTTRSPVQDCNELSTTVSDENGLFGKDAPLVRRFLPAPVGRIAGAACGLPGTA